jgi:nitrite reductase (NAD(P)H)
MLIDNLSIVQYVSCPLHKRNFTLTQGDCLNDSDYHILAFDAREAPDGTGGIQLHLPPVDEIDGVLGTEKWLVRQAYSEALGLNAATQAEIIPPAPGVDCGGGCGTNKLDW